MRRILFDIVLLGLALGLTVEVIKGAIPYLPAIWFGLTIYYIREAVCSDRALSFLNGIKARFSGRMLMYSYLIVALFSAGLAVLYWYGLNSFFAPKIAAYQAEQRDKKMHGDSKPDSHETSPLQGSGAKNDIPVEAILPYLRYEQQQNKIKNWPYGSSGSNYPMDLSKFFVFDFKEATDQRGLNGQDRFFLYYMLLHDCEMRNASELNDWYYKEFEGMAGNPVLQSMDKLTNLGLVDRISPLEARLKEPYYSRYKGKQIPDGRPPLVARKEEPNLLLYYGGKKLDGQIITLTKVIDPTSTTQPRMFIDPNNPSRFALSGISIGNDGEVTAEVQSAYLNFPSKVTPIASSPWQPSNEGTEFVENWNKTPISPHQPPIGIYTFMGEPVPTKGVKVKLRVFYGKSAPAEATFTIQPPAN